MGGTHRDKVKDENDEFPTHLNRNAIKMLLEIAMVKVTEVCNNAQHRMSIGIL